MDHLRMYTFAWRMLESRPRMYGFHGSKVPFLDVIIPQKIWGAALRSQGGSPFALGVGQTFSEGKTATCEGLRGT